MIQQSQCSHREWTDYWHIVSCFVILSLNHNPPMRVLSSRLIIVLRIERRCRRFDLTFVALDLTIAILQGDKIIVSRVPFSGGRIFTIIVTLLNLFWYWFSNNLFEQYPKNVRQAPTSHEVVVERAATKISLSWHFCHGRVIDFVYQNCSTQNYISLYVRRSSSGDFWSTHTSTRG
jgi:hypothetical protein